MNPHSGNVPIKRFIALSHVVLNAWPTVVIIVVGRKSQEDVLSPENRAATAKAVLGSRSPRTVAMPLLVPSPLPDNG